MREHATMTSVDHTDARARKSLCVHACICVRYKFTREILAVKFQDWLLAVKLQDRCRPSAACKAKAAAGSDATKQFVIVPLGCPWCVPARRCRGRCGHCAVGLLAGAFETPGTSNCIDLAHAILYCSCKLTLQEAS